MKFSDFLKYLFITTLICLLLFFGLGIFLPLRSSINLFWGSVGIFALLSLIIYMLVERSLALKDGKTILGLVVFNVFLKLVLSFGFVALYVKYNPPSDKLFLISFFIVYLSFTIFETWFLNHQARGSK